MENKDIIRLVDCAEYRKAEKVLAALLQEKPTDFFYHLKNYGGKGIIEISRYLTLDWWFTFRKNVVWNVVAFAK